MTLTKLANSAAVALILLGSASTFAADNALYDTPPPDDAAFVRWVGLGSQHPVFGIAPATHIADVYRPVSAAATNGAQPGTYYTAAAGPDGRVLLIEEPGREDRSKVHLFLVNLGSSPVRVAVTDQDMVVIDDTATGAAASRAVNPVSANLSLVTANGQTLASFDVTLRRGQNLTFVAHDDTARLIENSFGPNIDG
ncbi:MAG: alginate O-acetyltransferase AlgF [Pseudomonadota bacterium]